MKHLWTKIRRPGVWSKPIPPDRNTSTTVTALEIELKIKCKVYEVN